MQQDKDVSIEYAGFNLVLVKDRSKRAKAGKYAARAKAEKPKNQLLEKLDRECKKKAIRDIAQCKRRIAQARFHRRKAEDEGRESHRHETRYYLCFKHEAPQYHLTKLGEAEYAAKFEASKAGYTLAA